jgi:hypothetical protein
VSRPAKADLWSIASLRGPRYDFVVSVGGAFRLRLLSYIVGSFCACTIACSVSAAAFAQTRTLTDEPPEVISRVVLANSHVALDLDSLRAKLEELYPGQFVPPHIKGSFVVAGPKPGQFLIQSNVDGAAGVFLLTSVPKSYAQFSDFSKTIADGPFRRRAEAQCCWLSVTLISNSKSEAEAYRFVEQVLAKLAPVDAAFLVDPAKRVTIAFDDAIRSRFASGALILSSP